MVLSAQAHNWLYKCVFCFVAFGVAHQALEEIEPSEETVLIIGNYLAR